MGAENLAFDDFAIIAVSAGQAHKKGRAESPALYTVWQMNSFRRLGGRSQVVSDVGAPALDGLGLL